MYVCVTVYNAFVQHTYTLTLYCIGVKSIYILDTYTDTHTHTPTHTDTYAHTLGGAERGDSAG